ncbi:MAG: urease accessory protein UreD [Candidatus Obscuribacterales bacterium]|nr:urease accessory protein UreD [Steroidobacteraceae bacterium]
MSALPHLHSESWRADLRLGFERRGDRTVLATRSHIGPLLVQRPFYPEGDVCHVYLVHPPGGIVGGDQLRLDASLQPGSHALITTPAATKFYRTLPDRCSVLRQELSVHAATLEWLPQETIVFREARASMATCVRLHGQSQFIGWELTCYGRPASNELFDSGHLRQDFELWIDDQPVYLDHLRIDGASAAMKAPWGLAGHTMLGTLLAYPAIADDLESAREHEGFACTLVDRVLSCRFIGNDGDVAKRAFVKLWQTLRPRIIKRESVLPRIWAT